MPAVSRVGGRTLIPAPVLLDDESTREVARRRVDAIAGADVVVGPYGSDLVREAAVWAAANGRVCGNHGASVDDAESAAAVVSVASPACRYYEARAGGDRPTAAGRSCSCGRWPRSVRAFGRRGRG